MSNTIIELKDVTKVYIESPFAGVKSINLAIRQGAVTVISGESGSGKSTLLKLISGLMSPDTGSVLFKDEIVRGPESRLIPGHEAIKTVAQDFNLNIYAKVYDNIAGLLPNTNLKAKDQKAYEVMEFLRIDHLARKRAVDLSGGEQQRVAIARAIITDPEVLLLDEPFSQVDTLVKNELRADIKRMARYLGISVILVSHDPLDGLSLADEMVILKNGIILESGVPRHLYNAPGYLYTAQLLSNCNVLTADEAQELGISSYKDTIAVYPEWIRLEQGASLQFIIKDVFFKGSYEELLLDLNGIKLIAISTDPGKHTKGMQVNGRIERFVGFSESSK